MNDTIAGVLNENIEKNSFSGVLSVYRDKHQVFERAVGDRNKAEMLRNRIDTRFGIASGCKIFTAIAIAQLVDRGKVTFQSKLIDVLPIEFDHFDEHITIHHLLTHTSGIPDYFDEETMDDFEALWKERPVYLMKNGEDFLPFFQKEKMKGKPGKAFQYNNAGFILLGLVVEHLSGQRFTDYIQSSIFQPAGMMDSGYFSMDALPFNTAYGYIQKEGEMRTNIFSVPIQGGADGGAFVSARDMHLFWDALLQFKLISKSMTEMVLHSHQTVNETVDYGYGVWMKTSENAFLKYYIMGYDPGVSFHSAYYPKFGTTLVVGSN
ncbi:serine hydrolase domain-containing protein [Halobacillus locisalis]|nr:serine hydrolase [Halobacillus locisalis]